MSAIRIGALLGLLLAFGTATTATAHTANLTMAAPAKLQRATSTISASVLAPAACTNRAGLTLVTVASSATLSGTGANELLIGRNAATTINGGNGDDCLIGGQNADSLNGQGGTADVCIGGPATDTFNNACETQIQ